MTFLGGQRDRARGDQRGYPSPGLELRQVHDNPPLARPTELGMIVSASPSSKTTCRAGVCGARATTLHVQDVSVLGRHKGIVKRMSKAGHLKCCWGDEFVPELSGKAGKPQISANCFP